MFTHLHLRNFKAWRDTGPIRLAPLTVFFGVNSSGKTSLGQLLLMLQQTIESPDRQRVLHTGDHNTAVELGTFEDFVYAHDVARDIEIDFAWKLPKRLRVDNPLDPAQAFSGRQMGFEARIGRVPSGESNGRLVVHDLAYSLASDGGNNGDPLVVRMTRDDSARYALAAEPYALKQPRGRPPRMPAPNRFYGFPDEAVAYYQNSDFIQDFALALEQQFRDLHYVGPLREYPARTYLWSGEVPHDVGRRGERAVEAILAAQARQISPGSRRHYKAFQEVIARWLRALGLIETFNAAPIAEGRKEYEVRVQTARTAQEVHLTDVGFGVSQVLPVVVQCFYVPHDAVVLFEQPEIHLHPKVQAGLADLFVEAIHAREDSRDRNLQLIVESHSEHFLRRLQRRVAEGAVTPDDVALYVCRPGQNGAVIEPLQLDLYGNIANWPEHFFGDEMGDLVAMANAAEARQQQESTSA
ncbi:MAG: DUF3696 domain-containing protein [Acidobacteriota bacterium]